jgi:hypothetical protein
MDDDDTGRIAIADPKKLGLYQQLLDATGRLGFANTN